ncbi:MAG: hypothetical protein KGZ91_21330 [Afipia sp.]|nr:hypothetical protein [Afipia sp.]
MKKAKTLTGEQNAKPNQDDKPDREGLPTISLDQAVAKVNAGWRKQATEMMKLAQLCKATRDALSKDQRKFLMERVDMGRAVFNKICAIADTPFLQLPEVQNKIPSGYSLVWECTKMKEENFQAAIESGAIHPKITRKEIQALLPPKSSNITKGAKIPLLKINVDWSMPEYRKRSFEDWLREGHDKFPGIKINWDDLDKLKNAERTSAEQEIPNEKISVVPEFDPETVLDHADPKEEQV